MQTEVNRTFSIESEDVEVKHADSSEQITTATQEEDNSSQERKDRPLCGSLWFMGSMVFQPVDLFTVKYLYDKYPLIGAFQLIVARSIIGIVVMLLYLNRDLKKVTIDDIKNQPKGGLTFRSTQSAVAMILKTIVTKYISITIISIVYNMMPIFTVIIAYFALKERIDIFEMFILLATTAALVAIIVQGYSSNNKQIGWDEIMMYVLLLL